MSDRDSILGAIEDKPWHRHPADASQGLPAPDPQSDAPAFVSSPIDPWRQFEEKLNALGAGIIDEKEYETLAARRHWADPILEMTNTCESIWDAEVGFSVAAGAVAQTGTLILVSNDAGTYRLSSVVPPINVVVLNRATLVPTLHEALANLPKANIVFVTGPSRTADIEGVMVRGVHGPGQLLVLVR